MFLNRHYYYNISPYKTYIKKTQQQVEIEQPQRSISVHQIEHDLLTTKLEEQTSHKRRNINVSPKLRKPLITKSNPKLQPGPTIGNSQRLEASLILPFLSKGPQHYNVKIQGEAKGFISLEKQSKRIFDYTNFVPGVGAYDPYKSLQEEKQEQKQLQSDFSAFRPLSYISKSSTRLGPGYYFNQEDQEESPKGFSFLRADQNKIQGQEVPGVGDYYINDTLVAKRQPQNIFSKYMPDKVSSYGISIQHQNKQTPSPQSYRSLESFKKQVDTNRSMKFPQSQRKSFMKGETGPGPGSYTIEQNVTKLKEKKKIKTKPGLRFLPQNTFQVSDVSDQDSQSNNNEDQLARLDNKKIQGIGKVMSKIQQIKLVHLQQLVSGQRITQQEAMEFMNDRYKLEEIYKRIQPGPGNYSIATKFSNESSTFPSSVRRHEFLDTFGIPNRAPGPGSYVSEIKNKQTTKFSQSKRPQLFKINQTPSPGLYEFTSFKRFHKKQQKNLNILKQIEMQKILESVAAKMINKEHV